MNDFKPLVPEGTRMVITRVCRLLEYVIFVGLRVVLAGTALHLLTGAAFFRPAPVRPQFDVGSGGGTDRATSAGSACGRNPLSGPDLVPGTVLGLGIVPAHRADQGAPSCVGYHDGTFRGADKDGKGVPVSHD